jgi:hypothetical protein
MQVFWHDCDSLAMNGAQVGILKQSHQVCFRGLLQRQECRPLPSIILSHHIQLNLTDQPSKRQTTNEQVGAFLILADFFYSLFACGEKEVSMKLKTNPPQ